MEKAIETKNLTKKFGRLTAVDNVSISIDKGEIYGFLGLNGAGKTTTIRMLLGMMRPNSGAAYINGKEVNAGNHKLWKDVGYLVEMPYSYPELSVYENLELVRRLRGIEEKNAVESVIKRLHLDEYRDKHANKLSLGNAQRLGIAKAIMHNPSILFFDEPANGLDPAGIVEIRELLIDLAENRGVTIFISSHILGEISKFASRIGIINNGRLIQEADSQKISILKQKKLIVDVNDREGALKILINKGFSCLESDEGFIEIRDTDAIDHPDKISSLLVESGYPPILLKQKEEDLESYFFNAIKGEKI